MNKRLLLIFLSVLLLFPGCGKPKTEHVAVPEHTIMGAAITIDASLPAITRAYYEATDLIANVMIDRFFSPDTPPEFISFAFTSDMRINAQAKEELVTLFREAYGSVCEIDANGVRLEDDACYRGITVTYDAISKHQVSDCDLTLTIGIRYAQYTYFYCCDFNYEGNAYVLFRYEHLYKDIDLS